jgi:hypothetical protein
MDFQEDPHALLFSEFVQKRPGENLVLSDLEALTKKRMILWPRGIFKTTAVRVDIVQTILNYPNVRICFLTGGDTLAKLQLKAIKQVFEKPTAYFKHLFPEFCLKSVRNMRVRDEADPRAWTDVLCKMGNQHEFTVPARTNTTFAEPTFKISTAKAVKAGSHFDEIYIDDLVNELMDVHELIPTPAGFVRNGDLKTGDYTFGQDGVAYRVVAHPIQKRQAYKVSFDDGTSTLVHAGHLWTTWNFRERIALHRTSSKRRLSAKTRTTEEILATLHYDKKGHKTGHVVNHAVRVPDAVVLSEKKLLLHPYALGVWLGSGSSKQSVIAGVDLEIFERLESFGVHSKQLATKSPACPLHGVYLEKPTGLKRKGKNRFTSVLKQLEVFNNKHVPFDYLWSSKNQRLELLRGLMDTDGRCSQRGLCIFVNTNEKLADGVYQLASALGLKPRKSMNVSKPGKKTRGWYAGGVPTYRVIWTSSLPVFGLTRKLALLPKKTSQANWRYIINVEKTNQAIAMRCLTSENPEGLYLFGRNFNVTHNTNYRTVAALQKCHQDYIDICPLLEPTGFMVITGTRYSFGDTYELIQEDAKVEEKTLGRTIWRFSIRDCWSWGDLNCPHTDIYHDYAVNKLEPPCIVPGCPCKGFKSNGSKGVLFPQTRAHDGRLIGHTLEWLEGEKGRVGDEFFANQYENKPIATGSQTFTETLVGAQTFFNLNLMPTYSQAAESTYIVGDLAYVGEPGRDFSVLYIFRVFCGQIFVFDCMFGNWNAGQISENIVNCVIKHHPKYVFIEKYNGWDPQNRDITANAVAKGVTNIPIQWLKGSQAAGAKIIRIGAINGTLTSRRLWLYGNMPGYQKLVNQLVKWPKLGRHDDFADCMGMVIAAPTGWELVTPPTVVDPNSWLHSMIPVQTEQEIDSRPAGSYGPDDENSI